MAQLVLDPSLPRVRALDGALRAAIRDGLLAPGERLPSSRALADDLGLARATVVEAYTQLVAEGLLRSRRGAGTWVADFATARRSGAVPRQERRRSVRFSFDPGLPDLTSFPRAAWSRALRQGLRDLPASSLGYGDPRGRVELRQALADYLMRTRGVMADPELIVVCAGFSHVFALLTRALHQRGVRHIAMEDPCLRWHRNIAQVSGLAVVPVPVDERGARTDLLADSDPRLLFLAPAHQFPLGVVLHPERRTAAITWARATDSLLIEDDYDAELRYDRPPVGALQPLDPDRVAYAGSASKTLAPGLRLGWAVVPADLIDGVTALRRADDVHVAVTEQIAFGQLLGSGAFERHIRRMRSRYRARRDRVLAALAERAPTARPVGISAGLRVLLELPPDAPPAQELAERAAQRSIDLFPLAPCYHDSAGRQARNGLVLGYAALPEHEFEGGIKALGDLLSAALSG